MMSSMPSRSNWIWSRGDAVVPELLRHQELLGDAALLAARVAGHLDDFHAIAQRVRDVAAVVGGGDEGHVRQIEGQIDVVVDEGVVLRGVQHFEQGCGRIAAHVDAHLVDFVQDQDRVAATGLLQGLDDATRERADISAAVPADLRFVAHAAERDAPVAPTHGARDRLAERRLAHAGRPDEKQDRPLLVATQLADRRILDDALLHPVEAEVIFVQAALHLAHVDAVGRGARPGQIGQPLHVGARDLVLGRLRLHPAQAPELLSGGLFRFQRQLGARDAFAQLFDFVVVRGFAQLFADVAHLLAQHVVALRAAHLGVDERRDLVLDLEHLELARDHAQDQVDALTHVEGLEHSLPHVDAGLLFRKVRGDQIREGAGLAHVVQDARGLFREVRHQSQYFPRVLAQLLTQLMQDRRRLRGLADALDLGRHVRLEPGRGLHSEAPEAVQHDAVVGGPEANHFHDARQRADRVQIFEGGFDRLRVLLREHADHGAFLPEQLFDQAHAARTADVDRHHRHREQHRVPERQDRELLRSTWFGGRTHVSTVIRIDQRSSDRVIWAAMSAVSGVSRPAAR